jgi:hypothetical protein
MFRVVLFPLLTVLGDMCQDFCVERLGRGPCSKGSYCKRDYDCHNLFWTDETKTQICVLSGHGECTNRYPVLCREASSRQISRVTTTSTTPPSTSETPTAQVITTPQPVTRIPTLRTISPPVADTTHPLQARSNLVRSMRDFFRRIMRGRTPRTTAIPASRLAQQHRARDNVITLPLHFDYRSHPYIKLSFQNEGRNLGYYALFDSGSHQAYIFAESESNPFNQSHILFEPRIFRQSVGDPIARPANESEAYRLAPGVVPRNPTTLGYGIDGAVRRFESLGTINDTITVFSGESNQFTFHAPEIHMVRPPGDRQRALLGSQPESAFARAAEVFAVVPLSAVNPLSDSDWHLLIGRNSTSHAQGYCSPDDPNLRWFPRVGTWFWRIEGRFWLAGGYYTFRESRVVENIEMILDTGGTDRIHLSPVMMETVIAELESFGPRRIPSEGPYPRFENCTEALSRNSDILSLRIQPGTQRSHHDSLSRLFPINKYLQFDRRRVGECTLLWEIGIVGAPNRVVIGTWYLSKVVTVFDNLQNRVGMCRRGFNEIEDN